MPSAPADLKFSITFRHTESSEALKNYVTDKLSHCLNKYVSGEVDVQVVLSVEKLNHIAEVNMRARPYDISTRTITGDLYSAIDKAVDTVEAQLRKQKDRIVSSKHQGAPQG